MNDPVGLSTGVQDLEAGEVVVTPDEELNAWWQARLIIHRKTYNDMKHVGGKDFAKMIALYTFYYDKARQDKTNQPWALDKYCMKGLSWSNKTFYKIKNLLMDNGFIEQIKIRNPNGTMGGFYIKVNFLAKKTNVLSRRKATSGESLLVEKRETNALRSQLKVLKEDNNNVVVTFESKKHGAVEIPKYYIDQYGEDKIKENIEHLPMVCDNPPGWVIDSLEKGWSWPNNSTPRGSIRADLIPDKNVPNVVEWNPRDNTKVYYKGINYKIEVVEGSSWAVPE